MIDTIFYYAGMITMTVIISVIVSTGIFLLHRMWIEWYDDWLKADRGRIATFMKVVFNQGVVEVGEIWMINDKKYKIEEVEK